MRLITSMWLVVIAMLAGCSFEPGGLQPPDDRDGAPPIDRDGGPPDAGIDAAPDATVERDGDGDGVADDDDNCPMDANPEQEDCDADNLGDACDDDLDDGPDEDGDDIENACDNCPGVPNTDQASGMDEDAVGDACDPRPTEDGDSIAFVEFFDTDSAGPPEGWTVATGDGLGDAGWEVQSGALTSGLSAAVSIIYLSTLELPANLAIEARGSTIGVEVGGVNDVASAGVIAHYINDGGGFDDTGISCTIDQPTDLTSPARVRMRNLADVTPNVSDEADWSLVVTQRYATVQVQTGSSGTCTATPLDQQSPPAQVSSTVLPALTGGKLGLRVVRSRTKAEYIVVYALGGPL